MSSEIPPIGGDDIQQESADFLSTQFVFGPGAAHSSVGLDVLVTKVAVDFVGLTSEAGDSCVKRNLEALRDSTGVDAICSIRNEKSSSAWPAPLDCSRRSTRRC